MFVHQYIEGSGPHTILLLHGTGGDETDLISIGKLLVPGANILSPRGKVLEDGALRFFRRFKPGVFDEEDIRSRAAELAEFIAESSKERKFDSSRVFALGYSNGANIAQALMLLHPEILAGAAMLRPMPVIEPNPLPDLGGRPVLITAGEDDHMTTEQLTHKLASTLSNAGAKVDVKWIAAGHELTPYDFQAIKGYFQSLSR
jgi:predicted esterase